MCQGKVSESPKGLQECSTGNYRNHGPCRGNQAWVSLARLATIRLARAMETHRRFKWWRMVLYLCLTVTGGCWVGGNAPTVSPDGSISGGEPRLSALLELVSKGRPEPSEALYGASYVISVYPIEHMILAEGTLPQTKNAMEASYSIIASLDSAESAAVAVVTESIVGRDGKTSVRQQSQAYRWQSGRWVAQSFGELQIMRPSQ